MSFPKAKIVRFNEETGCAPGVGHYDPKNCAKVSSTVFETCQRFKEPSELVSCKKPYPYRDQSSSLSSISSTSSSLRSAKKSFMDSQMKESFPLGAAQTPTIDKHDDNTSVQIECDTQTFKEKFKIQDQLIKKLQKENIFLKSKLRNLHNNVDTTNRRTSMNSPPVCCSSPLLKYMGLSPIANSSATPSKDNWMLRETNYQKIISELQCQLRETERKCSSLKTKFRDKPVAIIVNGSPDRANQLMNSEELSPENRAFIEAKHSALLKLSFAEDEIYKLNEKLKDYKLTKQKLTLIDNENDEKTKKVEQLKTKIIKSDIELKEGRLFYSTLQQTFEGKVKSQDNEIHKLNQAVLELKNQLEAQHGQISLQTERENELTQKLINLKNETNYIKLEYEDLLHKGNDEIELLTVEMTNLRLILREKVELEEEFKSQIQQLQSNDQVVFVDLKNSLEEKMQQFVSDLQTASIKYKALEGVAKEKEEELAKLICEVQALKVKLEESKELLKKQVQIFNGEKLEWEVKLKQSEQNITDVKEFENQKLDHINELLTAESQLLAACEDKNSQLDIELKQSREEIKNQMENKLSLTSDISNLQRDISNFEATNIDLQKEKAVLENLLLEQETFELVLNKEIELLKSNQNQLKLENQVLKEQLETQLQEAAKNMDEKEQKEKELWTRLGEQKQQIKELKQELTALRDNTSETERWREQYEELLEKVEPFKDQLDLYAHERSLMVQETDQAWKELEKLQQKTAKAMGHQNHKQKIQYVMKLNGDLCTLRKENTQLKEENYKQFLALQKYQKAKSKSSGPLKEKENTQAAYF